MDFGFAALFPRSWHYYYFYICGRQGVQGRSGIVQYKELVGWLADCFEHVRPCLSSFMPCQSSTVMMLLCIVHHGHGVVGDMIYEWSRRRLHMTLPSTFMFSHGHSLVSLDRRSRAKIRQKK
jgi:hypothetical protein